MRLNGEAVTGKKFQDLDSRSSQVVIAVSYTYKRYAVVTILIFFQKLVLLLIAILLLLSEMEVDQQI
jgi:hypothetical protein